MFKFTDGMHDGRNHFRTATLQGSRFWIIFGIFVCAALLGADIIWTAFEEGSTLVLEFVAERVERFFQTSFGLDLYHAQMATAYTGAFALLIAGLLLWRKLAKITRYVREDGIAWWHDRSVRLSGNWHDKAERVIRWWGGLDLLNKSAVLIGLVLMVIPLAMLLSYGLGIMVSEVL